MNKSRQQCMNDMLAHGTGIIRVFPDGTEEVIAPEDFFKTLEELMDDSLNEDTSI